MRLADSMQPYLAGEVFDRGLEVEFVLDAADRPYTLRHDILEAMARGKRVIHAGCVDHSRELIDAKRARGLWLHERLTDAAERCLGVDIAAEGIEYLRSSLGYEDVHVEDVAFGAGDCFDGTAWDFLLLPEVLEHIGDPVSFLRAIHARFETKVETLVVTVPNAFSRGNCRRAADTREVINSDHRFWFTPFTAAKVLTDAGFQVDEIRMCTNVDPAGMGWLRRRYYERHPLVRDDIILTCGFAAAAP